MFELHRQGQRNPELLQAQAAALDEVDREVRLLEGTLDPAALDEQGTGDWTGEWEQPEENWSETSEWQQTGDWQTEGDQPVAEQTGDWQPEPALDEAWEQTVEWDAPEQEAAVDADDDESPERSA